MSTFEDPSEPMHHGRWYDQDPVLARAMEQLRLAPDRAQAQIALNIIKIVVEHRIEDTTDIAPETLSTLLNNGTLPHRNSGDDHREHRRWYDVQETLSSAIQLLSDCPDDLQKRIIPSIAHMIEQTLQEIPDQPLL